MSATHPTTDATTEAVERNLDLAERHLLAVLDDPTIALTVPAGAALILLPLDDAESFAANLRMAEGLARRGQDVFLHPIDRHGRPVEPGTG